MKKKYNPNNLLPALRLFAEARNKAVAQGFTDNGGAIHSVERILDILSASVCYPYVSHINNLKSHPKAELSEGAFLARQRGEPLKIEHVLPQRAYARVVINMIGNGATDSAILSYIKKNYRLVLLSEDETTTLNRINRSKISNTRLVDAGIKLKTARTI